MRDLLLSMFGAYVFGQFSAILGALVVWPAIQRGDAAPVEPADVFDAVEEEVDEVTRPVIAPVLARWFREPLGDWSLAGSAPHRHETAMGKSDNEGGPIGVPLPDPQPEPERVVALRPMSAMSVDERLESETVSITISRHRTVQPWWIGGRHRAPDSRARVASYADEGHFPTTEYPRLDWSARTQELGELDGVSG